MSDNSTNGSTEDPTKRRKLDTGELAADDAPTRAMPQGGAAVTPPSKGQAARPPAPSSGTPVTPRRNAAASATPRPAASGQPNPASAAKPRRNGQGGAAAGPRPTLPPPSTSRREAAAPLVPPVVKKQTATPAPRTLTPQQTGMSTRKKIGLGVLAAVLLVLLTGGWWIVGRLNKVNQIFSGDSTHIGIQVTQAPIIEVDPNGVIKTPTPGPQAPTRRPIQPQTEPVTILLLGLDHRVSDVEPPRSDTMILVHIDPSTKKVAMLSFPRDLWVTIPGLGEATKDRINAAYEYGEKQNLPGGGPALARATIKYNFGVDVDYFAEVDFTGFEKIVDTLGGVNVDVPKPLVDNEFPKNDGDLERVYIPAGIQHMDGKTALQYARSRHQDSDLGRNTRQQQVLLAIKQQGASLSTLANADALLDDLRYTIRTDLNADQVLSLITLAPSIGGGNITQASITADMVNETILDNGADVLLPDWDKIRPLIAQLFGTNSVALEGARIMVKNGTRTEGLATRTAQQLKQLGFKVVGTDNDNNTAHPKTEIINYSNKQFTASELAKALNLGADVIQNASNGPPDVDIVVILGDDKVAGY